MGLHTLILRQGRPAPWVAKGMVAGWPAAALGCVPASWPWPCVRPVHAAVLAINEAVERGVVRDTLAALQNPSALLEDLRGPLAALYQELLAQAKMEKAASARNHVREEGPRGAGGWKTAGQQDACLSCL